MIRPRWWMSLLILAALPMVASAQAKKRDALVIFKDGFFIKGKIDEQVRDMVYDSASGQAFPILSGQFFLDDHVRKIKFSPTNVQKVTQLKVGDVKEPMQILRISQYKPARDIHSTWEYANFSKWTGAGDRIVSMRAAKGIIEVEQKIGLFTPHHLAAIGTWYNWEVRYFTSEFSPKEIRDMLLKVFEEKKDLRSLPKGQKYLQIAGFFQEAGWFTEAESELANIVENFPDQKKLAEEMLGKLRKERADLFVESIKKASKVGQHQIALDRLDDYARLDYAKLVTPANRTEASDLVADYAKGKASVEAARKHLIALPLDINNKNQTKWTKATEFILKELNLDTVGRLDKFLLFAQQYETQRAAKDAKPTQTPEEVLALAISSWLQGDQAAEANTAAALNLAQAREFVLEYLKTDSEVNRTTMLSAFKRDNKLPMDVLARLVRMIPPPEPHDAKEINTEIQTIKIAAPNTNGGSYLVKLPPDYHHLRPYPVVIVLHSARENAEVTLKRFSEEAAKHGFILAAPKWTNGKAAQRGRQKDQDVVLDTLRDLRRRFQVDSDRVFLFGWEDGANLAIDLGLGHPDLFAGVVPMNGSLTAFQKKYYWANAQYLPFYVIEGDRNAGNAKQMHELFKEWTRSPFASMYVEYMGRGSEWFSAEVPLTMFWMSGKKRYAPMKEMGRANQGSGLGEEFHSSRPTDNRFYWLSSEGIEERCLADLTASVKGQYRPATFQANVLPGNKSKDGKADIWNQVNIRVSGMRQVTFWIPPELMDLSLPVQLNVNGAKGGRRQIEPNLGTMLEELYQSGDRQRLFVAKIELRS